MDSDVLASMYAQIVRGTPAKEDSKFVTDDESSQLWDTIAAEIAEMREANPQVQFDVPNEVPGAPGTAVLEDAPTGEDPTAEPDAEPEAPTPPEGEKPADKGDDE